MNWGSVVDDILCGLIEHVNMKNAWGRHNDLQQAWYM